MTSEFPRSKELGPDNDSDFWSLIKFYTIVKFQKQAVYQNILMCELFRLFCLS